MSMSGIEITQECHEFFEQMKLRNTHKYFVMKLSKDLKQVVLDHDMLGPAEQTTNAEDDEKCFNGLKALLKDDEPRYIVYNFGLEAEDGRDIQKMKFLDWCSDNCPINQQINHESAKTAVEKAVEQSSAFLLKELSDVDYASMSAEVVKKK